MQEELEMLKYTKSMVKNVNMSHSRYKDDLKRKKEERSTEEEEKARKRLAAQKIKDSKVYEIDSELKILSRKL